MNCDPKEQDRVLVQQCLSGSSEAWNEFYTQFHPLVRKAVEKHLLHKAADKEDMIQNVFLSLYTGLKNYDPTYTVSQFVWVVAKRVCIDDYRGSKSARRHGETVPVDHHNGGSEETTIVASCMESQEQSLRKAQLIEIMRRAYKHLGERCRTILYHRYFKDLPFKEIAVILGANKKSLAVQAGRCIDELKAKYAEHERKGLRS